MNRPLWDTFMQWRENSKEGYSNISFVINKPNVDGFTEILNSLNIPYIIKEAASGVNIATINYFDYVKLCSDDNSITNEIMGEYFE